MENKIVFVGYAPDADPTVPGIFTNCSHVLPTLRGFKASPTPEVTTLPALAAACQGAALVTKLDATTRFIAGTGTKLYEDNATSWTEVTRSAGGNYSVTSDTTWSFAQFNDVTLATQKADLLQFSSSSGKFADVSGAPKASLVETVGAFVFVFDTNEATYGDSPNRWWCAAEGDYTDWTPNVDTNCYTGTLSSSPGQIRAGKRFGNNIIVYKDRAMYIGYYSGNPIGWNFNEIPGDTGALSNNVVVKVGTPESPKHIFMGYNDFFSYDGSVPVPLGANVLKDTVYAALNRTYSSLCTALHDYINNRIFFFYPTSGNTTPDSCVVYNYKTNQWGRDDRTVEAVADYLSSGTTYNALGTSYSTYNDLNISKSYDTAFTYAGTPHNAFFDTSHTLQTLTGAASDSSITTGDYGDDSQFTTVTRIKPRFLTSPTTAQLTNYYKNELGDTHTADTIVPYTQYRFDLLREARWHRALIEFTGEMEINGLITETEVTGYE